MTLKQILQKICEDYGYRIKALEVMPDHIHIFVDVPQTVAPCDVVRTLKSKSAIELFKAYPTLKRFYARCGVLWSRGYFISTVGQISEATVMQYIEEQKVMNEKEYKKSLRQFHKHSDRHILVVETDMSFSDIQKVVALSDKIRKAGNELVGLMRKNYDQLIRTKRYRKVRKLYGATEEKKKRKYLPVS